MSAPVRPLRVLVRNKVDVGIIAAPRLNSAKHVVVRRSLIRNRMVHIHGNVRHLLARRALRVLARHITVGRRREKVTGSTLAEQVRQQVALHILAAKDVHVCELAQNIGNCVAAGIVQHLLPVVRENRVGSRAQVVVDVHQAGNGRHSVARSRGTVRVDNQRGHVGDRATKGPADHVQLRCIRVLQRSSPADGLRTARVTKTGHRCVLAQSKLVKAKRGTDRVERDVTTRTASSEGVHGTLAVRHSDDVTGLEVRKEQGLVNDKVGAALGTRGQTIARSSPGRIRVLRLTGHNKLVLQHVAGNKHRGHRVLRLVRAVLVGAVENLVGLLQALAKVGRVNIDGAPGQNVTRMRSLPITRGLVETIVVRGSDGGSGGDCRAPKGTKACQAHSNHRCGALVETFVPVLILDTLKDLMYPIRTKEEMRSPLPRVHLPFPILE